MAYFFDKDGNAVIKNNEGNWAYLTPGGVGGAASGQIFQQVPITAGSSRGGYDLIPVGGSDSSSTSSSSSTPAPTTSSSGRKLTGTTAIDSVYQFLDNFQPYQSSYSKYSQKPDISAAGYGRSPLRPYVPSASQLDFGNSSNIAALIGSRSGKSSKLNTPIQGLARGGLVKGVGGGTDDNVLRKARTGDYIMRADTMAALGDGNNEEGGRRLHKLLKPSFMACGGKVKAYAKGGKIGTPQDIAISPGEFHIPDEVVTHIGGGDNEKGAKKLKEAEALIESHAKKKKKKKKPKSPLSYLHIKGIKPKMPSTSVNPLKHIGSYA